VHPAALVLGVRVELAQRLPEAQGAVADGQLRPLRQAALAQPTEQLLPTGL